MQEDSQPATASFQAAIAAGHSHPERIAGRFLVEQLLGSGASGIVYQVVDESSGARLALKLLSALDPVSLFNFKSEFRTLANLSHRHWLKLYDLLAHGDQWLLTMELVDGTDFLSYVRPGLQGPHRPSGGRSDTASDAETKHEIDQETEVVECGVASQDDVPALTYSRGASAPLTGTLDEARLRAALEQLAEGLHALHQAARLHRDLKPANVLVSHAEARVIICDFGLTLLGERESNRPGKAPHSAADVMFQTRRNELAGTPMFMSPEQARAETLTAASDWYSVGAMLYLALTGRPPFEPRLPYAAMLQAKSERSVIAPQAIVADCPADLARLALALLEPNPHLRAGYAAVMSALSGQPIRELHAMPARRRIFIGREAQLEALHDAFIQTCNGQPAIALVSGRSGMGKSALIRHFLASVEDYPALVLRGRCYEHEELAYKTFDPLIDALSTYLVSLDPSTVRALAPSSIHCLAALFPALRRVRALTTQSADDANDIAPTERRRLAFAAFRELCQRLCRDRPLVLCIDDLQWGDLDSAEMFKELFRQPDAPPVLVVCAYRSEDVGHSRLPTILRDPSAQSPDGLQRHDVVVGPLAHQDIKQLALTMLREESWADQASDLIAGEAEGRPFLAQELAGYANEHGLQAVHQIKLESLIQSKLQALPDASRVLLSTVAVAGSPISTAIAGDAADLGADAFQALRDLDARRLIAIERIGSHEQVECAHDRIREAAMHCLGAAALERTHRSLAQALEAQPEVDCNALLVHWRGAGETARARHYALLGAERAEAGLAFARAADLYREGLALYPEDEPGARSVRERLGHALLLAGRGAEAASTFIALLDGATADEALRFRMLAATQLMRGGKLAEGFAELERADDLFGVRFPRSLPAALAMLATRRMRIRIRRGKLAAKHVERTRDDQHARLDALWEIAAAVSWSDFVRGSVYSSELTLRALASGSPFHLAGACGLEAVMAAASADSANCQRMLDLAEAASHKTGVPKIAARVRAMQAVCRQMQGRWLDSVRCARESQEIFKRCTGGVSWDTSIMIWWQAQSESMTGNLAEVIRSVPEALRDAEARGDVHAATSFRTHRSSWAWLGIDRADLVDAHVSIAEREWAPKDYQFQHWHMTYARAEADLYRDTPLPSLERVTQEWPRSRLVRQVHSARSDMLYARARLMLSAACNAYTPKLFKGAIADGRALIAQGRPWTVALGRLVLGCAASLEDRTEAARLLSEAEALLLAVDMRLHAAAARAARIAVADEALRPESLDTVLTEVNALGARNPERFLRMLAPVQVPGEAARGRTSLAR